LFLLRAQHDFLRTGFSGQVLDPAPHSFERQVKRLGGVFQPSGKLSSMLVHRVQGLVITWPVFPIDFVNREDMMSIKALPV